MSALGDLPLLDVAIFADTQWERRETYESYAFYRDWLEDHGIRVERVSSGNIRVLGAEEHIHIPFWTSDGGPLQRQCTVEFKLKPVKRRLRELVGFDASSPPAPPPGAIEVWIGISWDEWRRAKPSRQQYKVNRWPLIEKGMTRQDCIDYLRGKKLPVPIRSSCIGCPYRHSSEWLDMKQNYPDEFAEAVAFDEANRHNPLAERGSTADELYIYQKCVPLKDANLEGDTQEGKLSQPRTHPFVVCIDGNIYYRGV
jgi:3'-phosphoadenosine 5'-phosphosulfate sulfotransferase (PAPS reductase)/FAD synthetase